jgi:hypothetical protein
MEKLSLDIFIHSAYDLEFSQYKVLAAIKNYLEYLHKNKLYPTLSELISINDVLQKLLGNKADLKEKFPHDLISFDFDQKELIYKPSVNAENNVQSVFDFINWALPKINDALEEGKAIYDFVEEQMKLEEVGIIPIYKNEGYFLIPDHNAEKVYIFRFELSQIANQNEPMQSLKSKLIKTVVANKLMKYIPEQIKGDLIKESPELPNPATYNFIIEIDFPFNETILPIAKRKLLLKLAA